MSAQISPEQLIAAGPTSNTATDKLTTQVAPEVSHVEEVKETSLDDIPFDDSKFTAFKPAIVPKETQTTKEVAPKKEEPAKVESESAKEPETKVAPEVPTEIKPLTTKPVVKEDDYTGFDEAEQTYLKKMANDARAYVKPRLVELKDVKQKLKDAEVKLAEASKGPKIEQAHMYLLDQEFQGAVQNVTRLNEEQYAWQNALAAIDRSEKWKCPVGYNQDGSIRYEEREPSAEYRSIVISKLSASQGLIQKNQDRANHIAGTYNERYQERIRAVKQYEDYLFPEFSDPKAAEANPSIKSMKEFLVKSGFGDNVLANAFAKMYAFAMHNTARIAELESKQTVKEVVKEVRANNGPTGSEINTGRTGSNGTIDYSKPDEIPFDDKAFDKLKA